MFLEFSPQTAWRAFKVTKRLMSFSVHLWVTIRKRLAAWAGRQATQLSSPNFWVSVWSAWRWWTPAKRR